MSQDKWVIIAELLLDSGTEYVSGERVRRFGGSPSTLQIVYSGTVERWGTIEKSIPCPSGMPQISNAHIRITDHVRHWRNLLAVQTPRRRIMRITMMPAGASVADYDPVYTGEVVDVAFPPAAIEIELRDRTFAWLDELIPAMAVPELYPEISAKDEGGFIPFVFGDVVSEEASPIVAEGIIPLPHLGLFDDGSPPIPYDCWGVAVTPVLSYVLYRREKTSIDADESLPEWAEVDESEYITIENVIAAEDNPYGDFSMTHTLAGFLELQPDGTEIRADVRGIYTRGGWGTLLPIDGSSGSPPGTIHNQIDHFINMTDFIMRKAGVSVDVFDTAEISALWQQFEDMVTVGLSWDFATTEEMTCREWLGRFLPSGNLDMPCTNHGLITLAFSTTDVQSPVVVVPVFKEGKHILRESFSERLPEHIVNQLQGRYAYDNARDRFASWTIVNTPEQDILALPDENSPSNTIEKIEKDVVDLYCIRNEATADEIMELRLAFQSLGSFRQTFEMPAPATFEDVELAKLVAITHSMGLEAPSGYVARQAKILSYTLDLDALRFTIETVVFPPVSLPGIGSGRPTIAEEWEDPAFVNPLRSRIVDGILAIDDDASVGNSLTYAELQITSTNSVTPNYAQLHLYDFPEPTAGQTLDDVILHIVTEYNQQGHATGPVIDVWLLNGYTTVFPAPNPPEFIAAFHVYTATETKTEYTLTYTAAQFTTLFGGLASNIYVRCQQWSTLSLSFSPDVVLRVYDCWVEYTYV